MREVYKFWRLEHSKENPSKAADDEAPVANDGNPDADAAARPRGVQQAGEPAEPREPAQEDQALQRKSKDAHAELIRSLKQMQTQRHTLDILADVVADRRVKLYAEAYLA